MIWTQGSLTVHFSTTICIFHLPRLPICSVPSDIARRSQTTRTSRPAPPESSMRTYWDSPRMFWSAFNFISVSSGLQSQSAAELDSKELQFFTSDIPCEQFSAVVPSMGSHSSRFHSYILVRAGPRDGKSGASSEKERLSELRCASPAAPRRHPTERRRSSTAGRRPRRALQPPSAAPSAPGTPHRVTRIAIRQQQHQHQHRHQHEQEQEHQQQQQRQQRRQRQRQRKSSPACTRTAALEWHSPPLLQSLGPTWPGLP